MRRSLCRGSWRGWEGRVGEVMGGVVMVILAFLKVQICGGFLNPFTFLRYLSVFPRCCL